MRTVHGATPKDQENAMIITVITAMITLLNHRLVQVRYYIV